MFKCRVLHSLRDSCRLVYARLNSQLKRNVVAYLYLWFSVISVLSAIQGHVR